MVDSITVYASIGNSDDKLTQAKWAEFHELFAALIHKAAMQVHGDWVSPSASRWQNACIGFEIASDAAQHLKSVLGELAAEYGQDSIAWATAATEFIGPDRGADESGYTTGGLTDLPAASGFSTFCACGTITGGIRADNPDRPMRHPAAPQYITVNMHSSIVDPTTIARTLQDSLRRYGGPGGTPPQRA